MNLDQLTILTASFNNNLLTGMMLKSFKKQVGKLPNVVIVDNGNKTPVDDNLKECFNVIDNFNYKLLSNELQSSRNHCKSIDYALKNCIKTKWVLLVDNDVLFYPELKNFLINLDETKYDAIGEIGWDITPPNRLFPYFCLINVEKFNKENLNYFDRNRIVSFNMPNHTDPIKDNLYDTGYSFLEDIKNNWKIFNIKISNYCNHLKGASLRNKDYLLWLKNNKNLL